MVKATLLEGVSDAKKPLFIPEGKSILSALPEGTDPEKLRVMVNGLLASPQHIAEEGELIAVRILPGDMVAVGIILGGLALIAGIAVGADLYNQNKEMQRQLAEIEKLRNNMSASQVNLPWIKGATNAVATGKTQPYIIGEHSFAPYIMNSGGTARGYNVLAGANGKDVYYVAVLNAGFGKQVLKTLSMGDSVVKTFDATTTPQEDVYTFDQGSVFADESSLLEVAQDGKPFLYDEFNNKVQQQTLNDQLLKKDTDGEHPLVYTIPVNSMSADICILINGLIAYTSDGGSTDRTIQVIPSYRVKKNGVWGEWVDFGFERSRLTVEKKYKIYANGWYLEHFKNQSQRYQDGAEQRRRDEYDIGKHNSLNIIKQGGNEYFRVREEDSAYYYNSIDKIKRTYSDWDIENVTKTLSSGSIKDSVGYEIPQGFKVRQETMRYYSDADVTLSYVVNEVTSTTFTGQTKNQMRYNAHVDFDPADVIGAEEIQIKITTPTEAYTAGSCYDDVYVQWVQSRTYDTEKSTTDYFCPERILSEKGASLSTLIGIRVKSTVSNEDRMDKFNLVTQGVARTWDAEEGEWSPARVPTRNPAAWLLEVLTSETHLPSRVDESELDLASFGELYEWCESQTVTDSDGTVKACPLRVDMVITQAETKQQVLEKILATCQSVLYRNSAGLIAVATDKAQENAIGLLNPQNLISFKWSMDNARRTDEIDIKYTDHSTFQEATYPVSLSESLETSSQIEGHIIREMSITGIEEPENIVRYGRYLIACSELRRRTCTAVVGMEGTFYAPYSKVLVQHPALQNGLGHAVIKAVVTDTEGNITGFDLYQNIVLDGESEYHVIVNCTGTDGEGTPLPSAYAIENTAGTTRHVQLSEPIAYWAPVKPQPGDILSWGYGVDTVTTPYIVTGVEPNGEKSFTLTLTNYNEAIYDTGKIPAYRPNVTKRLEAVPSEVPDPSTLFREYAKKGEQGYQRFEFAAGNETMTQAELEALTWTDASPEIAEGQYLWMRTRWEEN